MRRAFRTLSRCLICGFTEVRTDEVIDRGVVLLSECPRCEHRWTGRALAQTKDVVKASFTHREEVNAA
jgi:hypothetical protein